MRHTHRVIRLAVATTLAALLAHCDFPPDPPLKSTGSTVGTNNIDSARALLPLKGGNFWVYTVSSIMPNSMPQPPVMATAAEVTFSGNVFYELRYLYYPQMSGMDVTYAFPPILRLRDRNLSFYDKPMFSDSVFTKMPKLLFTLPYPARVGVTTSDPHSEYMVTVLAKDTLLSSYDGTLQYRCYKYGITRRGSPLMAIMYALPGSALLRVDVDNLVFYTTEWRVE